MTTSVKPFPLYAVVPAAGVGARMGASLPKQYLTLEGRTLAEHTLQRLLAFAPLSGVVVAVAEGDPWWSRLSLHDHPRIRTVTGGASRAESVRAGLQAVLEQAPDAWALVHDMARPLVRLSDIQKLIDGVGEQGGILACPVVDTIKRAGPGQCIDATVDRNLIWRALTPQLFPAAALAEALAVPGDAITDEASAMEARGWRPSLVAGNADNIKITVPEDLPLARFYLRRQGLDSGQEESS
ncbi:2-C-methyl-D-erythritol 4-phosphate cytidylyltransferase [Alloalcanivorax xenomutans]|uniref:2-C-methyl-D-erythritol 4-phosphate cytidylyltransferase n=1 Tax=Alloalcanivorax xenomutans TaxID=1094342 RepID=UPI00292F316B|nr:2-C-methyl-D-erythritol 4-phosphate cytidylyltransferase [Alloalcanivorax xenomutans]WOA33307.1 2-C-methyl-D-erythritol 4-phosphate cytidylyltransferase [Alloalcanivorax xenomutans]